MAVALTALFVALGGSSYAALTIGSAQIRDNSVAGRDLRNDDVQGKDVKNGSLASRDVKDGSLLSRDFKPGQLGTGNQGPAGPQGVAGPAGATGPQGPQGPGLSGLTFANAFSANDSASSKVAVATCPAGKRATAVSYDIQGGKAGAQPNVTSAITVDSVDLSRPSTLPGTGLVEAYESSAFAGAWTIFVEVTCADATP